MEKYRNRMRNYNAILLGLVAGFLNTILGNTLYNLSFWIILLVAIIINQFILYLIEEN